MSKWVISITAAVLGTSILVLVVAGTPVRDEVDWQVATRADTAESYAEYLRAWPAGRYGAEATSRLEEREWEQALVVDTIAAYAAYLQA